MGRLALAPTAVIIRTFQNKDAVVVLHAAGNEMGGDLLYFFLQDHLVPQAVCFDFVDSQSQVVHLFLHHDGVDGGRAALLHALLHVFQVVQADVHFLVYLLPHVAFQLYDSLLDVSHDGLALDCGIGGLHVPEWGRLYGGEWRGLHGREWFWGKPHCLLGVISGKTHAQALHGRDF